MKEFPGTLEKRPVPCGRNLSGTILKYVLTDEQRDWLCRWFPEIENSRLMKASGMTHSTLHRFACDLGLTKSAKGMRAIKKRQAAHIKKLCEQNGYYDSLRGKALSESCREGVAQMWQDIRDGKREHPIKSLKRKNPRKYKRMLEMRKESRVELIRKEKRRAIYGLERHTKLYLPVVAYTKRQTSHRHNALRRGYFYSDVRDEHSPERFIIYYDDDTQRSAKFEQNLISDGFTVKRDD